ncbi:N-acetylmuramoyl-L-alanine amidase [Gordonia sp. CPCC 205333]|uniref:N-acetylmuramoyl-L-alanine amidase n=1 Tax=Gordonia sp. CPCC 205333 TaxID=3140790 RepID=UPI003AF3AC7B
MALDPGHNPVRIESFDPKTGAAQIDYPNGAEDGDAFSVASQVAEILRARGYRVVLLKRSPNENVSYRQRVDRAEAVGAQIGISIHTSPGVNAVFAQRVGLFREGSGVDGATVRVTFRAERTAAASQRYATKVAAARSRSEWHPVTVQDNDFSGRAPLWSGNIPIISLIAQSTPWVYNEFSSGTTGGSIAVEPTALRAYAKGIAAGVQQALPRRC